MTMKALTPEFVKTTVNLRSDEVDMIKKLAAARGTTLTEVLRAAVRDSNLLADEQDRGGKILIKEADGSIKQLVFRR